MGTIRCRVNTLGILSASVILLNCGPFSPDDLTPEERAAGGAGAAKAICGNGIVETGEDCDDDHAGAGDGCSDHCEVEHGFSCMHATNAPSTCTTSCGDGQIAGTEECDVGALASDGCDDCKMKPGFFCYGEPNACIPIVQEVSYNGSFQLADANATATMNPIEIKTDSIVSGAASSSDSDYFRLKLSKQAIVRFETFDDSGSDCVGVDTQLIVFDVNHWSPYQEKDANVDDKGIGKCSALVEILPVGIGYVKVASGAQTSTEYRLEINFPHDSGNETEPNDTLANANALRGLDDSPNVFAGGTLLPKDVDYFSIAVPDGMSVRAEIIEKTPGFGPTCANGISATLTLHDAHGPRLTATGGGRGNCALIDGTGTGGAAEAHRLPAGNYHLAVESTATTNAFDYNLVVTVR